MSMFLRAWRPLRVARGFATKISDVPEYLDAHRYPPANTFVESDLTPVEGSGRPEPINVEMTHYAPFKHKQTHGHKVADVMLASFHTKDLETLGDFVLRVAFYLGIPAKGATPLPRKIKRWTVIRSPFAQAKSKENFERITYRRRVSLFDANPELVQILLAVVRKHTMAGVGVKASVYTNESLEMVETMDVPTQKDVENPLSINKVLLDTSDGDVAKAVMELLKDPQFDASELLESEKNSASASQ